MSEEDQEKYLDDALKIVKSQAFHMGKTIENNQLRQCLKESSIMLSELKTGLLSPRNYYTLYTIIFHDMQYLEQYFKEEHRRGRKIKDLYDAVQQASSIIPRLYLLITVGSVYIESQQVPAMEIIFDLLQMVKGVQNPLRGLFLRYYFLKMVKDKLPDKGSEYEKENSTLDDTIKFILQNLEEMNRLWIRLSTGVTGTEKILREKERNELKVLVGENITRLSSLNGLTLEIYRDEVLPKIITILLDSKDQLSQQYLMECIIHAFPDDYNITCMNSILDTCTKLVPAVDIKSLFISLMEKLARFVSNADNSGVDILEQAEKIFDLLRINIDKIIEDGSQSTIDSLKLIELQVAFIKFTLKCCPNKLEMVNHIMNSSVNIMSKLKSEMTHKLSHDGVKLLVKLLSAPLESTLSIFEMPHFPNLMNYLDFSSRTTLSLRIIESLVNENSREKLDSAEKISILLDFIRPILVDSADSVDLDVYQFEYEQQFVTKLIFIIHNSDPNTQFEMLNTLKNIFIKGGTRRQKFTLPALVNAYFILSSSASYSYDVKLNESSSAGRPILEDFAKRTEASFNNPNEYAQFMKKLYNVINDLIGIISVEYSEISFKLFLNAVSQINDLKGEREQFEEFGYTFATNALSIIQEGKIENDKKLNLIVIFVGTLTAVNFLCSDNMTTITANLVQVSQTLVKRSDQCVAMINCSHLYFNDVLKDLSKVQDCLTKAKRFADFAMTNAQNLNLFIHIVNKYLHYIEKGLDFVKADTLNDIIEVIKNHIHTIKTENNNPTFLIEIEKYFETTCEVIAMRKNAKNHKIFDEIII